MQQVVLYLANALEDVRPRHAGVGEMRTIKIRRGVVRVAVITPSGKHLDIPFQPQDTTALTPVLTELGIHRILMSPADGEPAEVASERFSVWPPAAESDLTPMTDEELAARMPEGATLLTGQQISAPIRPLWMWLLVLLQMLMLAEGSLARRG
jgi:hypothetical protein